ncbi:MAG: sulfurtransferase TusA family protein [Planctomycetes bacterium]|nr:sulfurtransferase TusA family protein [Planctomycetota bacterium]
MSAERGAAASFDGGELDCGSGLLLLIRQHIDPLLPGQVLELFSTEPSVSEDLPAWCRLTGNELLRHEKHGTRLRFLIAKGGATRPVASPALAPRPSAGTALALPPLAVGGIGSWPRPAWLLEALAARLEGRMNATEFEARAQDAVELCHAAQMRAGVDFVTDGEQRRDAYASFVGAHLDGCRLIPLVDLLPYVDDPQHFAAELAALDIRAQEVRHPAVFGPLARREPLALREAEHLRTLGERPIKVALPGPYLLTRTMWLECVSERAYATREALARDVVRVLRAELADLLAAGVALVQLDEPVLTEVVHGVPAEAARAQRSFMCGALGAKLDVANELAFAEQLLSEVARGFPRERLALHVCRGNWSADESVALRGSYAPLRELLFRAPVGTLFLELCTPRVGERELLLELPADKCLGIGVVNPKDPRIESTAEIRALAEPFVSRFGTERVRLTPDCGFATFAGNPIASARMAEAKLAAIAAAARELRGTTGGRPA